MRQLLQQEAIPQQRITEPRRLGRDPNAPAPPTVSAVRVTVTATNGDPNARINEIRLYDEAGVTPFPTHP